MPNLWIPVSEKCLASRLTNEIEYAVWEIKTENVDHYNTT